MWQNIKLINRENTASIDSGDQTPSIRYCPNCERYHLKRLLKPRLDYFAADADLWLQCYACGKVFSKYEAKEEGHIEAVVTVSDNPFSDLVGGAQGVDHRGGRRGNIHGHHKTTPQYKDGDVNEAVRKGGKVLNYSES